MSRALTRTVERLARLDPNVWHRVTMQMAWHYRTAGARLAPPQILAAFGGQAPHPDVWRDVRRRVSAKRKAARQDEARHAERQRREQRRAYMRKYMRQYRKTHANL